MRKGGREGGQGERESDGRVREMERRDGKGIDGEGGRERGAS